MKHKGIIKFFAIAFALVCVYHLSFTFITNQVEKKAEEVSKGDPKLRYRYLDSIASQEVYNFFYLRHFTYRECKERELNLGLDLKGGMNVTLEVSVIDVIKAMSNYSKDTTFLSAIDLAKKMQKNSQEDFVTLFGKAFQTIDPNARLAAIFSTVELKDKINYNSTNEDVLKVIRKETEDAIDNTFNILRTRIDRFGVTQPNIQKLETSGRILVELPGIKEPERVRKLLQGTASLEFWETYENAQVFQYMANLNTKIRELNKAQEALKNNENAVKPAEIKKDQKTEEPATAEQTIGSDSLSSLIKEISKDSVSTDTTSASFDKFRKENPLFAVLSPRIDNEYKPLRGAAVGICHVKDTGVVNRYLNIAQQKQLFPRELRLLWGVKAIDKEGKYYELIAIKVTNRDNRPALDGDVVTDARAEFGNNRADAEVAMSMNGEGAKIWARLTKDNVDRQIAIVLDNYVYSYPTVQTEIKGGRSSITGRFSVAEAKDLANILKSGKLPAPAHIIQEAIVGPSLGVKAINDGLMSFVIAFILVIIYMIFYYNRAGVAANIALITNLFFIIGIMASLGAVLTLPGIAGIVLTLGMAVDANVIIYERIREELRAGKGLRLAVADGYKAAYSAIIDANVTTLIIAIILGYFGKGPIHGFAVTLGIGILTSLFTAIFITRLWFEWHLQKDWKINFSIPLTQNILCNAKVNFLGYRKYLYYFSGTTITIAIISIIIRGFSFSIDFTGGRTYIVKFPEKVNTVQMAEMLGRTLGEVPEVKTFGAENQVKITTKYLISDEMPGEDVVVSTREIIGNDLEVDIDNIVESQIYRGLKPMLGEGVSFDKFISDYRQSSEKVGPTIADDIKSSAVYSIIIALALIFVYIVIRFRKWEYGVGAVVSLIHDVLFVLGIYSLLYSIVPFSMALDLSFIAAILTVVGYSINDTVIVFDRVREYVHLYPKRPRFEVFNQAMNSTLGRTLNTSFTTLIVLFTIFFFGGEVIKGFIFAMLIGIFVGTYSSIYIATAIAFDVFEYSERKNAKKLEK